MLSVGGMLRAHGGGPFSLNVKKEQEKNPITAEIQINSDDTNFLWLNWLESLCFAILKLKQIRVLYRGYFSFLVILFLINGKTPVWTIYFK